jgi:hypothetical protein
MTLYYTLQGPSSHVFYMSVVEYRQYFRPILEFFQALCIIIQQRLDFTRLLEGPENDQPCLL